MEEKPSEIFFCAFFRKERAKIFWLRKKLSGKEVTSLIDGGHFVSLCVVCFDVFNYPYLGKHVKRNNDFFRKLFL
jgi:hypothetical protein